MDLGCIERHEFLTTFVFVGSSIPNLRSKKRSFVIKGNLVFRGDHVRTSIVTEHPSQEITVKMVCATCAQRCLGVRWENSLASAARSDDKIKFEKLKLDERSIVL